jgi:hypothetical protein
MRPLDGTTLEVIAETICGGSAGGGGANYSTPGPYRSKSEIISFFGRVGVQPRGESSTRKWFVLESLQYLNQHSTADLESVLLRLASPLEYRNDASTMHAVITHLNQVLQVEGLEIALDGVSPRLRQTTATVAPPKPVYKREPAPDFRKLVADAELADILCFRWEEAQRCVEAGAHLAAVVMMGSILEGVLLHKVEQNIATANSAKAAPKEKATGKPRPIGDWGISVLIDVAHEVGWLQGDMKRFSHALRESRNIVHPYLQRLLKENPDHDTCAICWQVVRAGVADLLEVESKTPRGTGA